MYEQSFNPYGGNLSIVKGYFRSGKVLALAILNIISAFISIITVTNSTTNRVYSEALSTLRQYGIDVPYSITSGSSAAMAGYTFGRIVGSAAIPVLTAVALILIFAKSRNNADSSNPIAGVTILYVLAIISLVIYIIAVAAVAIIYFIACYTVMSLSSAFSRYSSNSTAIFALVMIGLIAAGVCAVLILYAVAQKNFYRSVRRSITSVDLLTKGAAAFGVFSILTAVVNGIYAIVYIAKSDAGSMLSSIIAMVIAILTASLAFGYNKYIRRQKAGYNNTPFGGTPANTYTPASDNLPPYSEPASYQMPQNTPYQNASANNYSAPADNYTVPANEPTVCSRCGAPIDPSLPFCGNCGNKL